MQSLFINIMIITLIIGKIHLTKNYYYKIVSIRNFRKIRFYYSTKVFLNKSY